MKVTILGSGAFGLSLATLLTNRTKHEVIVYTAIKEEYQEIKNYHTHQRVLPDILLDERIKITMKLEESVMNTDFLVVAVPTSVIRMILKQIQPILQQETTLLFVSKGLEEQSHKLVSEIKEEVGILNPFGILAGPTFAKELLNNIPAGMTLATTDQKVKKQVIELLNNTEIELEFSDDIIGLEYCGAIKNTFAILMGAILTKNSFDTVKSYLLVKMIREEKKLLPLFGGDPKTVDTYAGIGDLLLTCTSTNSRNFSYGKSLVLKEKYEGMTVEGKKALSSLIAILENKGINQSIFHDIASFMEEKITLEEILEHLRG